MKNRFPLVAALLAGVLSIAGCSANTQGDDASPVYLEVSYELLPLTWNVGGGAPLQIQTTSVKSFLKNPGGGTSNFLDTLLDEYVVEWSRIDGGTKAPGSEPFAGNVVIPANGTSTLTNYPYMTASALLLPPLDQLLPYNGGIDRETRKSEIRCKATVTYRGHTMSGQPVRGVGNFDMIFIYSAATQGVVGRVN